jgi:hypothetical protein
MGPLAFLIALGTFILAVYWVFAIVEVLTIPSWQFENAGSNKLLWIGIVFFLEIIGALLWLFVKRSDVLNAQDWSDQDPPADWYMDQEAGTLRWWDGMGWTDRYNTWSGGRPRATG